jgi:hypothetical protein
MSRVPDLLVDSELESRTTALRENGFEHETNMLDEALAVMAEIAEHPPSLRNATLLLIPDIAREQLAAYRLIEPGDAEGVRWRLTERGGQMAEVLRDAALAEDPEQAAREASELDIELRRSEAEFGVDDPGGEKPTRHAP